MIAAMALLDVLHHLGVTLAVEGDRLRYRAPAGVMSSELRAAVNKVRGNLLLLLGGAELAGPPPCGSCGVVATVVVEMADGRLLCRRC